LYKIKNMKPLKYRKEINLDTQTMVILQMQANRQGKNLKNYLENILIEKATTIELTEDYKNEMDKMLEKHYAGTIYYLEWEDVKKDLLETKDYYSNINPALYKKCISDKLII